MKFTRKAHKAKSHYAPWTNPKTEQDRFKESKLRSMPTEERSTGTPAAYRESSVTELSTHPWNDTCWNIGGTQLMAV